MSTSGSQANGGRYNRPGIAAVLYTSLNKETAVAEVLKGLRARGVDPNHFRLGDWWVYEIRVTLRDVLDLRDSATQSLLGTTPNVLIGETIAETRRIGADARRDGFQAVLAPSAALAGRHNLVLFLDTLPAPPDVLFSAAVDLSRAIE